MHRTLKILAGSVLVLQALVIARAQAAAPVALDGPSPSAAFDVNAPGRIVGSVAGPLGNARAVLWRSADAPAFELLLLPGTNWSRAFGVNARGQIVGQLQDKNGLAPVTFAAYWGGEWESPVALASGTLAQAINSAGQIVGNMRAGSSLHAALWQDPISDPLDLGTFGGPSSSGAALNDAGQIVGTASFATGARRAAFWASASEAPVDLGTLPGATRSSAQAINESGEIVAAMHSSRQASAWRSTGRAQTPRPFRSRRSAAQRLRPLASTIAGALSARLRTP